MSRYPSQRTSYEASVPFGPSFSEQGIGVEEVLFALGLLNSAFYDGLRPAAPRDIAEVEALWGKALPDSYRCFAECAGASLGSLQIRDWRNPWDLRTQSIASLFAERGKEQLKVWLKEQSLPMALQGPTTELGYEDDAYLLLDTQTGELRSTDFDREGYEGLPALLLEWGVRQLDARMAVPMAANRAWSADARTSSNVGALRELAASMQSAEEARFVGRDLAIYFFHDSGVIMKRLSAHEVRVEARHGRKLSSDRSQAGAFLQKVRAAGLLHKT